MVDRLLKNSIKTQSKLDKILVHFAFLRQRLMGLIFAAWRLKGGFAQESLIMDVCKIGFITTGVKIGPT